jgi:hypothetical protein
MTWMTGANDDSGLDKLFAGVSNKFLSKRDNFCLRIGHSRYPKNTFLVFCTAIALKYLCGLTMVSTAV